MFRQIIRRCFSSSLRSSVGGGREGRKARLAYLSDVHLEVNNFKKPFHYRNVQAKEVGYPDNFPEKCHGIILAGDIGKAGTPELEDFLWQISDEFGQVFYVPGNHEYWGDSRGYFWANEWLKGLEGKIDGLQVLINGESYDLKVDGEETDIRIIGGTLWSHLPSDRFKDNYPKMKDLMNLYFEEGQLISPEVWNELFMENLLWFSEEFQAAEEDEKKVVAISHHAPMVRWTCHPKFLGLTSYPKPSFTNKQFKIDRKKWNNYAFSTDIDLITEPNLKAWIFGHTHYRCAYNLPQNALLASNPVGFHKDGARFPQIYRDFCVSID